MSDTHRTEAETPQDILQTEREPVQPGEVPVRLMNRVRVDQLPMRIGTTVTVNVSSTNPEKLLPANPKRGALSLMLAGTAVRFANTREACRRDDSSFVINVSTNLPFRFHFTDELWAMKTAAGSGADAVSILTEDWVR